MRRITTGCLGAALVAIAFGVSGCGGSGVGEGFPSDTTTPPIPDTVQMKMLPVKNKQVRGKTTRTRGHASVLRSEASRQA